MVTLKCALFGSNSSVPKLFAIDERLFSNTIDKAKKLLTLFDGKQCND